VLPERVEQAPQEPEQRHPLELHAAQLLGGLLAPLCEPLVAMGVAQGLGGERPHDLDEPHVLVRERGPVAEGAQEDRPDRHAAPRDRDHRDGLDAPRLQLALHVLQHRVVGGVRDEDHLPTLQGAPQLGVALEVHHVVADGRILVGRHQPHRVASPVGEEDGAAVEAERLTQLPRDDLEDVDEVEGALHFPQDLDHREQVLAFLLQLRDPRREPLALGVGEGGGNGHGIQ
jgi:hypothetical protein